MNLEEIKKRAEAMRGAGYEGFTWAADTILQLCAEVENKVSHEEYRNEYKLRESLKAEIEKLTAANKIMRDEVGFAIKYLESTGIQNLQFRDEPEHQMLNGLKKALAEADEVLK